MPSHMIYDMQLFFIILKSSARDSGHEHLPTNDESHGSYAMACIILWRFFMLYEVIVEEVLPLGPNPYQKHFEDIETDDPLAYVKSHCKYPIIETDTNQYGETVITCGDGQYTVKYTFSE